MLKAAKGSVSVRWFVAGDGNGHVGIGTGKSAEVPDAINKAGAVARKSLVKIKLSGTTIPYETVVKFGAAKVLLKPASPGTWHYRRRQRQSGCGSCGN